MPDAEIDPDEAASSPPVEVVQVPEATPVREVFPVTFMAPGADPVATRDFRPQGYVFKDGEEDYPDEDGHGNFKHPSAPEIKHPSEPRESLPYEKEGHVPLVDEKSRDIATEKQEASESEGTPKQGSPFER